MKDFHRLSPALFRNYSLLAKKHNVNANRTTHKKSLLWSEPLVLCERSLEKFDLHVTDGNSTHSVVTNLSGISEKSIRDHGVAMGIMRFGV